MQYCVKIILAQEFCPLKIEITQFPEGFLIISCLILKKNYRRFKRLILLHSWTKKKKNRIYARLTAMHIWPNWPLLFKRWITLSTRQISIQWIGQLIPNTYLLNSDSSVGWRLIQLLYNRRLYFIFIYCLHSLSA